MNTTQPPSSADARAYEHSKRLAEVTRAERARGYSGLLLELALGWEAQQKGFSK